MELISLKIFKFLQKVKMKGINDDFRQNMSPAVQAIKEQSKLAAQSAGKREPQEGQI